MIDLFGFYVHLALVVFAGLATIVLVTTIVVAIRTRDGDTQ